MNICPLKIKTIWTVTYLDYSIQLVRYVLASGKIWSLCSLLSLPQLVAMTRKSFDLSEVPGSIASSLISNSGGVAFRFVFHLPLPPTAEPHGRPYVFVDQHVEEWLLFV